MALRLRILSANLWNGRADPGALAQLVHDEEVDVACVQELTHAQAEALAQVLPHGRVEPAEDHTGMGIALRRPAKVGWLPLPYRSMRGARLDPKHWNGLSEPVCVWNLHVRAPTQGSPLRSARIRRGQLRGVLKHLSRPAAPRLVLVGDLNATPVWPVYRRIAAQIPDAALAHARRRGEPAPRTWAPWTGAERLRLLRIDHAFARGVNVLEVRRVHVPKSDHDGLCIDVALDCAGSGARARTESRDRPDGGPDGPGRGSEAGG